MVCNEYECHVSEKCEARMNSENVQGRRAYEKRSPPGIMKMKQDKIPLASKPLPRDKRVGFPDTFVKPPCGDETKIMRCGL